MFVWYTIFSKNWLVQIPTVSIWSGGPVYRVQKSVLVANAYATWQVSEVQIKHSGLKIEIWDLKYMITQ